MNSTLTEIESLGLKSQYNFADGHAYHDLSENQLNIVRNLPKIWEETRSKTVGEIEHDYKSSFVELSKSHSLGPCKNFRICPTASNSIDIVGAWLAENKIKTALLEPTFDNLYLLLKRRGVEVSALKEDILYDETHFPPDFNDVGAIFIVNPNNPTGRTLSREKFVSVINYCLKTSKTLLLDNTFRFFVEQEYDQYQLLLDSGVSFISIEDTGKVWPTQDMKASLIFFSDDISKELNIIYEEIYLCVSNFNLGILTEFLKDAKEVGLQKCVWDEVSSRRQFFRDSIANSPLRVCKNSVNSKLSVEWVEIYDTFESDMHILNFFKKKNLMLLPGRNFYWNHHSQLITNKIRFSFLKPKLHFKAAVEALRLGLREATSSEREFL